MPNLLTFISYQNNYQKVRHAPSCTTNTIILCAKIVSISAIFNKISDTVTPILT
jgi:hypothetical protein